MSEGTRLEWGLICDRRQYGLGRMLLRTAYVREHIDPQYDCWLDKPHTHEAVVRTVTTTEWEPVSGIGNFNPADPSTPAAEERAR